MKGLISCEFENCLQWVRDGEVEPCEGMNQPNLFDDHDKHDDDDDGDDGDDQDDQDKHDNDDVHDDEGVILEKMKNKINIWPKIC